ncbi:peptidase inhibitor family I36 protein [Streptomyces sp. ISL-14]|nr:peptidase inhibitor family I36 protein [Streptomyces sp. ISL-14]
MTIKTTAKRISVGIATLALAGTAFAGSAHAEDVSTKASSDCPKGWLCVWSGTNYTGRMQKVQYDNADLSQYTVFANGSLSVFNNGNSCDVKVYAGKNYTDLIQTVKRGDKHTGGGVPVKVLSNKWVNCS